MSDKERIGPALSATEWDAIIQADDRRAAALGEAQEQLEGLHGSHPQFEAIVARVIALLNDLLPEGDQRKIDGDSIALMGRSAARLLGEAERGPRTAEAAAGMRTDADALHIFADALAHYVPPEEL